MITFTQVPSVFPDYTMPPARELLSAPRPGFSTGYSPITQSAGPLADAFPDLKIDFGLRRMGPNEAIAETDQRESVWVLLRGSAHLEFGGQRATVQRTNLFEEAPSALHLGPETPVAIHDQSGDTEWAIVRTGNERRFAPRLYLPRDLQPEYRGAGLVQNAALRNVRLIFDRTTRPESNLVLGEVVNFPGRWSSYPPHHHDQGVGDHRGSNALRLPESASIEDTGAGG